MTSSIGSTNFLRSLQLLYKLAEIGASHFILCPGSRSAPLALAAGELHRQGFIKLINSIDERSAGFHAVGISAASGNISVVITTSGTAVANLLPAAVEADKSSIPIIFISADRPLRLKDCGSNQTVNQEDFLEKTCKEVYITNPVGLHMIKDYELENLITSLVKNFSYSPKPIHLNIPFEKPFDISIADKKKIYETFDQTIIKLEKKLLKQYFPYDDECSIESKFRNLNFQDTGIIIVGPYRGSPEDLDGFNIALKKIQDITGWPVFADPISGVNSSLRGLVENWELIISTKKILLESKQLLRIGPLPTSCHLEEFLRDFRGHQFLIKEKDSRNLDPINKAIQYEFGIEKFVKDILSTNSFKAFKRKDAITLANCLINEGKRITSIIREFFSINNNISESFLAHFIPEIWPEKSSIMLSASSPIRDWLTFSANKTLTRRCFSFRGASGIDGTLSLALGIARVNPPLLLVTGDLAFLHDINGWLIENASNLRIIILLIDNFGGNIFNNLYRNNLSKEEISKLFIMPRRIKWEDLAGMHKIPYRTSSNFKKLKEDLQWGLCMQKSVIIRVRIDVENDLNIRNSIIDRINAN